MINPVLIYFGEESQADFHDRQVQCVRQYIVQKELADPWVESQQVTNWGRVSPMKEAFHYFGRRLNHKRFFGGLLDCDEEGLQRQEKGGQA